METNSTYKVAATEACYYHLDSGVEAATTTNSFFLPGDTIDYIATNGYLDTLNIIRETVDGNFTFAIMESRSK
jgi:hypothetical protein